MAEDLTQDALAAASGEWHRISVYDITGGGPGFVAVGFAHGYSCGTLGADPFVESQMITVQPIDDDFVVLTVTPAFPSFVPSTSVMWTYTPPQN